jgi:four helix bundle protein
MPINSYKQLEVWKKGIEIVEAIYKVSKSFPNEEKYGLASQMQRAAVSIPSNIAEGHSRGHRREYQRFCQIALGACAELETQLTIASRLSYLSKGDLAGLEECLNHESRMLVKLINKLNPK